MKKTTLFFLLIICCCFYGQNINKKIALVIGNADYHKGQLKNPVKDAELIKETLEKLNFDNIIYAENLKSKYDMMFKIVEFKNKRKEFDLGFIYYAGHGVQVNGENYLLPTKTSFICEDDVIKNGVNVQEITNILLNTSNGVNVLVLDACRNNPLKKKNCSSDSNSKNNLIVINERKSDNNNFHSRSLGENGLARIEALKGSLIAFSTSANRTAADGNDDNSLYSKSLAKNMLIPDKSLSQIFQNVRVDVIKESNKVGLEQVPEEYSKLTEDIYLLKTDKFRFANSLYSMNDIEYFDFIENLKTKKTNDKILLQNSNKNDSIEYFDKIISNTKIIELDSKNYTAYFNRGVAYYNLGKYKDAERDLTKAINENSIKDLYYYRGSTYMNLCEYDKAVEDFNFEIQYYEHTDSYFNRGFCYYNLKKYESAIDDFSKVIKLENNKDSYYNRGICNINLNKFKNAIDDFSNAISIDSSKSSLFYARGYVYSILSKFKKAKNDFSSAIKLDSTNPRYFYARGLMYNYDFKFKEAINDFSNVIKLDSTNPEYFYMRGFMYYYDFKFKEAKNDFSHSINLDSTKAEYYYMRGITIEELIDQNRDRIEILRFENDIPIFRIYELYYEKLIRYDFLKSCDLDKKYCLQIE